MAITGLKTRLDYDDYCAIPPDGKIYEILDGRVHVTPAPNPFHQRASKRLQRQLEEYFEKTGRGEVFNAPIDVILTPHDVVQPDLAVVTQPAQISKRGIEGAPTLLVEVLSPSTRQYDRATKSGRYAELGVPHFWILDPEEKTLECFRLEGERYQAAGLFEPGEPFSHPDFPGLEVSLERIFA